MNSRALGILMLVVGIILLVFGLNATDSVSDTVSEGVTGRYTDTTMWYLIGGAVLAIGGALMAFFGRRTSRRL
jgi:hypothetical protein